MDAPDPPQPEASPRNAVSLGLVSLCFFLSGMAGLIYQMVWMRYLSAVFGTSELAIVAVLVAYMGGLATGAWVASKCLYRLRQPIIAYAVLELLIAISAVAVPWLLWLAGIIQIRLLGGQSTPPADGGIAEAIAHLILGCLVLFIPTACMGATLPILAKGLVHRSTQIGRRVGWLYALNTFGAVAGTLIAAFLLIPMLGLWRASFIGVGLNLSVAALGWSIARGSRTGGFESAPSEADPAEGREPLDIIAPAVLLVMFASGGISFIYEVLWARLLAHVLGGSFFSFATMLAAFLAGIAIGGLIGARLARDVRSSCLWLAGFEVATGLFTATILTVISTGNISSSDGSIFAQAMTCAMVLMPATVCLGATFPLAVRCLSARAQDAGPVAGKVYAWNTIGAIGGAIAAGLIIIPAIGYASSFKWAITGNLGLAGVALAAMRPPPRPMLVAASSLALTVAFLYHPKPPVGLLTRSPHEKSESPDTDLRLLHFATGRSATVSVLERRGSLIIRSNGLQEAEIFPRGAESLSYTHIRWLPALPKVLMPAAESLLVVGFGGGALLESIPAGFKTVDVVEIEAEVIRANRLVAERRAIDPFADPRLNIIINDARGALKLTDRNYDVIVSQPSHPWTAGASHLYTREFLKLSAQHLNPGGVFVQWLGSSFVDETLLGSFCAAALEVFPHVQLYLIGDNFVIASSDQALDERLWSKAEVFHLSGYPKLSYLEDLLAVLQLDEAGCRSLAAGHAPITDDRNMMATHHLPGKDFDGALKRPENLVRAIGPWHFLNRNPVQVREQLLASDVDLRYLTRLLGSGSPALDKARFYREVLTDGDRAIAAAAAAINRNPDQASGQLESAVASGAAADARVSLLALAQFNYAIGAWKHRKGTPLPLEFADFLEENPTLRESLGPLGSAERSLLEARYWGATRQPDRLRQIDDVLTSFDDHRSPWFEPAYQLRLASLLDSTGKTETQSGRDIQTATDLIDELLARPLERNLSLVQQRIFLAQRSRDAEFLTSIAWIIARKLQRLPAGASAAMRQPFAQLLGAIFAPYLPAPDRPTPSLRDPRMTDLYSEMCAELGAGAIPVPAGSLEANHRP